MTCTADRRPGDVGEHRRLRQHRHQRGSEHLRRQVAGQLGIAGAVAEVGEHRPLVAPVERRERRPVRRRPHQQALVLFALEAPHL
jgi:hypothetical protein